MANNIRAWFFYSNWKAKSSIFSRPISSFLQSYWMHLLQYLTKHQQKCPKSAWKFCDDFIWVIFLLRIFLRSNKMLFFKWGLIFTNFSSITTFIKLYRLLVYESTRKYVRIKSYMYIFQKCTSHTGVNPLFNKIFFRFFWQKWSLNISEMHISKFLGLWCIICSKITNFYVSDKQKIAVNLNFAS